MRFNYLYSLLILFVAISCKNESTSVKNNNTYSKNTITHAKGLEIYNYNSFSIIKVTNPWPEAKESYTYVLYKKGTQIPDSLSHLSSIQIPVKSAVVTSTTHIPSLEMLGVENTLTGFPDTDYISSEKTRALITVGKVKNVGANESLNTENIIDLNPDIIVGFSISSNNKALNNLEQSGLKVLYNGDWTEETPLGKAEWIKFFGALYDKNEEAEKIFSDIEKSYNESVAIAKKSVNRPSVLSGAMYQDKWYMPQGSSWASVFFKDANADYLWSHTTGTGSLSLSFEAVFDRAQQADFWIGTSQFTSLKEMKEDNPHYTEFKSFKNKALYSTSTKKGETGGIIYYELAPNRPDLVLKDIIKIIHPEILPDHELVFFEQLK